MLHVGTALGWGSVRPSSLGKMTAEMGNHQLVTELSSSCVWFLMVLKHISTLAAALHESPWMTQVATQPLSGIYPSGQWDLSKEGKLLTCF